MAKPFDLITLFHAIDHSDTDTFCELITEECRFRFGNAPIVQGKAAIRDYLDGFFKSISGLSHEIIESWSLEDKVICHGKVTYTRKDNSQLQIPFSNIFTLVNGQASDYLIFADTSALYAP